jgi:uncharacterized protein
LSLAVFSTRHASRPIEGGTVPFIARYRKEATGNLDEVQIRAIEEKLLYFRELVSRKETILASIQEQGKLTDELKARIDQTLDKSELEDLYLPYKPKRRTKAMIAREKAWTRSRTICGRRADRYAARNIRRVFCRRRKRRRHRGRSARRRAPHRCRNHQRQRRHSQALRRAMFEEGVIVSKKSTDAVDEQQKFKMYYDYREPVKQIPSHRMLAIRRGETENVLYFLIELDPQRPPRPHQEQDPQTARRLDSALNLGGGRRLEAPAQ